MDAALRSHAHLPSASQLRVCTLNIAHGRGRRLHQGFLLRRIIEAHLGAAARVLRREAPDVVALQEADGPCLWSGGFDHVAYLARRIGHPFRVHGHHVRLGGINPRLRYGTALLACAPLDDVHDQPFDIKPLGPNKGFVAAAVPLAGSGAQSVDVVSCHLDPARPRVRRRQAEELVAALATRGRPLVLMGDFNTRDFGPRSALRVLADGLGLDLHEPEATALATFPSRRPRRRLDWILHSRHFRVARYEVLEERISDHCAVVADLYSEAPASRATGSGAIRSDR